LSVDKNGEEQRSSQRKGKLHGGREGLIAAQPKGDGLLRVGPTCVCTNDLLNTANPSKKSQHVPPSWIGRAKIEKPGRESLIPMPSPLSSQPICRLHERSLLSNHENASGK
jgi:hypothetical protein